MLSRIPTRSTEVVDVLRFEDLSSRRARIQQLEGLAIEVDLSFSDARTSMSSQLVRCIPSMESISFAKVAVRNLLELGLHQLGESKRLAIISVVSILRASPEFCSEYPLLDSIATIFSDSDVAQARSTLLMAKLEDFHHKHRRDEVMEQENLFARTQIKNLTVEYDANENRSKETGGEDP
ncbi:TMV resistance protein N-like [Dorcoceras hygrometricum]|uniref:TMV resistance protein N-like n=1 Tax=Dorcoceras hygrometricum TaxID=472368 RepID=A0A2Z7CVS8_9LAMI|nr:TMV resistance protein N-like [Dorcoceras hygrometricum]